MVNEVDILIPVVIALMALEVPGSSETCTAGLSIRRVHFLASEVFLPLSLYSRTVKKCLTL